MKTSRFLSLLATGCFAVSCLVFCSLTNSAHADPIPKKYRKAVRKGLQWLAKHQHKDGHWGANGNQYPVSMTGLAGMALLMEGSTIRTGRYADNIRRATDWLMAKSQKGGNRDGLLIEPTSSNRTRYMYGHGFATLFLASVYGNEDDKDRRERLKDILTRAVKYTCNAQSSRGGWYYISKTEGRDQDEGSVTITQVQALRAARNAGIPVPLETIKKARQYLQKCTSPNGAVYYSFRSRNERPAITAAAVACAFNSGEYNDKYVKKWLKYCQRTIGGTGGAAGVRFGHEEYTHYYFSQCVYVLGDRGWEKLYGETPKGQQITWSAYRRGLFDKLLGRQQSDGSWTSRGGFGSPGNVYSTALYTTIMQLDNNTLPIYQR